MFCLNDHFILLFEKELKYITQLSIDSISSPNYTTLNFLMKFANKSKDLTSNHTIHEKPQIKSSKPMRNIYQPNLLYQNMKLYKIM